MKSAGRHFAVPKKVIDGASLALVVVLPLVIMTCIFVLASFTMQWIGIR